MMLSWMLLNIYNNNNIYMKKEARLIFLEAEKAFHNLNFPVCLKFWEIRTAPDTEKFYSRY